MVYLKSLQLLAAVVLVGGPFFLSVIWRPALDRSSPPGHRQGLEAHVVRWIRLGATIAALLLSLGALGDLLRLASNLTHEAFWNAKTLGLAYELAVASSAGRYFALRILSALALLALRPWRRLGRISLYTGGLASLGVLISFSLTGHSAAGPGDVFLPVLADLIHLAATSIWFGGLIFFALLPWRTLLENSLTPVLISTVDRFSRMGVISVVLMAITGIFLAYERIYGLRALVEHDYGQILLIKLIFLHGVLALAAINHYWVRRALPGASATGGVPRIAKLSTLLRWLVTGEAALGLGVLLFAAILTTTTPPLGEPHRFTVVLADLSLEPTALEVQRGWPVRLTVENRGSTIHSYVIRQIPHEMLTGGHAHDHAGGDHHHHGKPVIEDMRIIVNPGRKETVTFIPTRYGEYTVYCMVEDHEPKGMAGVIIVN